jgi:hypothetical protein
LDESGERLDESVVALRVVVEQNAAASEFGAKPGDGA